MLALLAALTLLGCGRSSASPKAAHLSNGEGCGRLVALTFDDGPNPPFTQQILQILESSGAKATFFVEGQAAEAHPDVVKLVDAAGMDVESHSYSHSQGLATADAADFRSDLDAASAALESILGRQPTLYRPPFGNTSDTMLMELADAGYTSIGWDVDSTDWQETDPSKIVDAVLSQVHPGAIVLMHDGGLSGGNPDRTATIQALPSILSGLRDRGYELKTVSEIIDPAVCNPTGR
ncbi:MAG: polysaccharide deacetylase family protein [Dehalococcoidia bacterium]